ncbi:MAG: type IX secretion system PorP/SprF family membrane protein [Flavobacteriales bacterium]|jgi:type IX secretion system PorP/SprF family membrane protein
MKIKAGRKLTCNIILAIALLSSFGAIAQQDPIYSQYMFNTLSINPAYAGSRDALSATILHRSQWAGFEGAPQTQTLTLHSPFKEANIGVGLSVVNDKIGPVQQTGVYVDLAYKLQVTDKGFLRLGLKGGANLYSASLGTIFTGSGANQTGDIAFSQNISNEIMPNVGVGFYYSTPTFYFGGSAPKLLENDLSLEDGGQTTLIKNESRHYFLIAGAVVNLNRDIKLKPTVLTRFVANAPFSFDLTTNVIFYEKFTLGLLYRYDATIGGIVQYSINDQLNVGYAYDYNTTDFGAYSGASHEVMVSYDFVFSRRNVRTPRYF